MAGVGVRKKWEKGEITQQRVIFRNRKSAKGRNPRKKMPQPVMQGK